MRRLLALTSAVALVLAGCAGDDATGTTNPETTSTTSATDTTTTTTVAPTTTTTLVAEFDASCSSPEGFSVSYPGDWETNSGEVVPECTQFDPNAFTVPDGTDERVAAITLYLEDVPYTALTDPIESDRLLSRESLTVDGHEATRVEYEANDDGIVPEHTRITSYYVDLESEGRSLVANTMDYTTIDYPRATRVLDQMIDTLDIDEDATAEVDPVGEFTAPPIMSPGFPSSGDASHLTDVRVGYHEGFERVVFEFEPGENFSYEVEYVEEPIAPSGEPVTVAGEATLDVTMTPASAMENVGEDPEETYTGPNRFETSGELIAELARVEDFENVLVWAIGLERSGNVAVSTLEDPFRLVIDIATG